jgi:lysozyme
VTASPTASALELVKHFEGCRLRAYQDQGGVWTVGYGCTGPNIGGDTTWTQAQADAEVEARVVRAQHVLEAMLDQPAADHQKAAMVSLAYNIGLPAFERSTVRRLFNLGDTAGAADAFRMWSKVAGKVNQGLVNRREAERAVFLKE